ncbi:MAG: carbohydrate kinase [Deltaproteobacteria bacterium]|nr:carbohydrate kinase [Deltaproteobacteria bacterium]
MNVTGRGTGSCIAVLDVGKTNQKLLIYDDSLTVIDSSYETFQDHDVDGIQCEGVTAIADWFQETLGVMGRRHDIGAISVTSHGGAFVCLDEEGNITLPVVSYTYDPGEEFHRRFLHVCGDARTLQRETATPDYPGLGCLGKGIYFAKEHFKEEFQKTRAILNLPQYFGYVLTGEKAVEHTYLGCTTFLWNFDAMEWSPVVDALGIRDVLPARIARPWDVLGRLSPAVARKTGLSENVRVTVGIHDSNSALLPYLITKKDRPFVLNSTGTFCVEMHPAERVYFSDEELGKFVFYNLDAFSHPVKTALFLGGMEFDIYTGILAGVHGGTPFPAFREDLYRGVLSDRKLFIIPGGVTGGGMFPDSEARIIENDIVHTFDEVIAGVKQPAFFGDFEQAYAVLNISIAIETQVAMERVGLTEGMEIFIEGGFRKNDSYLALLSAMNPRSRLFLTNLDEATSFGAAILGKCALENTSPDALGHLFEIETQEIAWRELPEIDAYREAFLGFTG